MKSFITSILLFFCISITFAQDGIGQKVPSKGQEKTNKGQYEESYNKKEHPYTIFVKTKNDFNLLAEIDNLERKIYLDTLRSGLKSYYVNLYKSAVTPFDPDDTLQIDGHIKYTTWEIRNGALFTGI